MAAIEPVRSDVESRCRGKTAMLFVGGSRAHHYQDLFSEIGMKTVAAGYEFAHRDDYEGRNVLPSVTADADSRNIEELEVQADPQRYRPRKTAEELAALKAAGLPLKDYEGLMPTMAEDALIIDDISEHETARLIELYKPDVFCAGVKEKYGIQKKGVPSKQLHSYDYGGPYAAFAGAANFWREIDRMINTRIWSFLKAPWQKNAEGPTLNATLVRP
jgi:nitrogenase molybdenum-iron protein alpha chain